MRKATFVLIVVLLAVATLAFAGGGQETSKAAMGGKVALTAYMYNDRADPVEAPNYDIILNAFRATYPDVDLKIEWGFSEPYHNKLAAKLASKQIDDITFLWPDKRTGEVTKSGLIKDLRPWTKGHENEFAAGALGPQGPNGEVWELPEQMTATHVVYVNTKLLKDLGLTYPKSFEELVAQGPKILAANLIPIAMDNRDGWQMQSCFLSGLVAQSGGKAWFDKALSGKGGSFTDPEFVNALSVIETLYKNKMFSPGMNQAAYGVAVEDFVAGKAVYMIDGGWRTNALVTNENVSPEMKQAIELKVFPGVPNGKGIAGGTATVVGTGYGMHSKLEGAQAEAAWKWIWFYSGPVGSTIRSGFGAIPAYKLPESGKLDILNKKLIAFLNTTPGGYVVDSVMDPEAMGLLHPLLQELTLGRKTAQQVAQEFETWVKANASSRKM